MIQILEIAKKVFHICTGNRLSTEDVWMITKTSSNQREGTVRPGGRQGSTTPLLE